MLQIFNFWNTKIVHFKFDNRGGDICNSVSARNSDEKIWGKDLFSGHAQ